MDRGALWATVLGVAELSTTEQLTFAVTKGKVKVKVARSCLTLYDPIQSSEFSRPQKEISLYFSGGPIPLQTVQD